MDRLRVACGQFQARLGDKAFNLELMTQQAHIAHDAGCQVIVFAELAVSGYLQASKVAEIAEPLTEAPVPAATPLGEAGCARGAPALLLVTSEDMHPDEALLREADIRGTCIAADRALLWGDKARAFVAEAARDMAASLGDTGKAPVKRIDALNAEAIVQASREAGVNRVVAPYAPVGPVATRLADIAKALEGEGIELVQVRRDWDETFWPHARKGFFPFKQHMGRLLEDMGLTRT